MQILIPIDAENALREDLTAIQGDNAIPVSASWPHDVESRLPWARVHRYGGRRISEVVDEHDLNVEVLADNDAEAMEYSNMLLAYCRALMDKDYTDNPSGAEWLEVEESSFPVLSIDSTQPALSHTDFFITATCRARAIEV